MYRYSLKNLPYTVSTMVKDRIHMISDPIRVTAHSGMDSRKLVSSIADAISGGILY